MTAANSGLIKAVELLIEHGADKDINAINEDNSSALIFAANGGHTRICEILIENGADVNQANIHSQTALLLASSIGKKSSVFHWIDLLL